VKPVPKKGMRRMNRQERKPRATRREGFRQDKRGEDKIGGERWSWGRASKGREYEGGTTNSGRCENSAPLLFHPSGKVRKMKEGK